MTPRGGLTVLMSFISLIIVLISLPTAENTFYIGRYCKTMDRVEVHYKIQWYEHYCNELSLVAGITTPTNTWDQTHLNPSLIWFFSISLSICLFDFFSLLWASTLSSMLVEFLVIFITSVINWLLPPSSGAMSWDSFHRLDSIYSWMDGWEDLSYFWHKWILRFNLLLTS